MTRVLSWELSVNSRLMEKLKRRSLKSQTFPYDRSREMSRINKGQRERERSVEIETRGSSTGRAFDTKDYAIMVAIIK